jgi:hypothetical protein
MGVLTQESISRTIKKFKCAVRGTFSHLFLVQNDWGQHTAYFDGGLWIVQLQNFQSKVGANGINIYGPNFIA